MTQFRSIIDTHNEMLKVIPENQKQLISDLIEFTNKLKTNTKIFTKKYIL